MVLKEDDVIFCTVKKIEGTSVFVEIDGEDRQGTIVLSEVAAGRIRNLREYVSPNRKIVCKVLSLNKGHIELSLRRVTTKEREHVLDNYKKEKALISILKVAGEDAESVAQKIKSENDIGDFLDEARENPKLFEKYVRKENAKKIVEFLVEKEVKDKLVGKKFILSSETNSGVSEIKEILDKLDGEIKYLGSSVFSISVFGKELKEADNKLSGLLEEIEKRAKSKKAHFGIVREKN